MRLLSSLRQPLSSLLLCASLALFGTAHPLGLAAQTTPKGDVPTSSTATVPRLYVTFTKGATLADVHANKSVYQDVSIRIEGGGGYPDLAATVAGFRGRGNSTWTYPKKPYRIKFAKKTAPLGLTAAKSWALLANYQHNAQLTGAIMMRAGQWAGASSVNHIIPVELYVDDQYQGLYNLTEKVGFSDASVVVPKSKEAALLELDSYFDEDYRFRDNYLGLPVNVKDPDLADLSSDEARNSYMVTLTDRFNELTRKIAQRDQSLESLIDTASLARFLFVNDLIGNLEINHPKSAYLYTTKVADKSALWQFGPVWDADWAFGYEQNRRYGTTNPVFKLFESSVQDSGTAFYQGLLQLSPGTQRELSRLFQRFVNQGGIDELNAYIGRFATFIAPAMERDRQLWNQSEANYNRVATQLQNWLSQRASYLNTQHLSEAKLVAIGRIDAQAPAATARSLEALSNETAVYTLDGRQVGTMADLRAEKLPRGLYVAAHLRILY